jgi:hypothetical protein
MKLLADWVGKTVEVTLRAAIPVTLHGVLLAVDEASILLELAKGRTVIPVSSILHVSLRGEA